MQIYIYIKNEKSRPIQPKIKVLAAPSAVVGRQGPQEQHKGVWRATVGEGNHHKIK